MKQSVYHFTKEVEPEKLNLNRIKPVPVSDEELTGYVNGIDASDIEERFARELDKRDIPFEFRKAMLAPRNMPGSYEVDFLIYHNGLEYPVAIDGEYAHKSAEQRAKDRMKDLIFNEAKRGELEPVIRLDYTKLDSPETTEQTVDDLLEGR